MEDTNWDNYGVGNYEKCADCMVHSGFEASAVKDTIRRPWAAAKAQLFGIRSDGPMAPEIPLDRQRPAEYVFSRNVQQKLSELQAQAANKDNAKKETVNAA
ncbi:MAG TPA: DUF3463 domain-containing protein, partial [Enterovirga sp.]